MIKGEVERLGGQTIAFESKELLDMTSPFQYTAENLDRDRVVKNAITQHAFEHFNHAAYAALAEAARYYNEPETAQVCEAIMSQDMEMAEMVESKLPEIVKQFLSSQQR
ncbi:MAG: hypothetical protein BWY68_00300 [bacterium ADurb.Bin400]|nr:MAG: hypothetical protein BWY68_00300 [bacterium ADurb.Bin400]